MKLFSSRNSAEKEILGLAIGSMDLDGVLILSRETMFLALCVWIERKFGRRE